MNGKKPQKTIEEYEAEARKLIEPVMDGVDFLDGVDFPYWAKDENDRRTQLKSIQIMLLDILNQLEGNEQQ